MSKPPEFSIIVPTFGRSALLAEALESIAQQLLENFECLVVDDASPDSLQPHLPDRRFRLIRRSKNGGPAAARNSGIALATGAAILFLDDDDRFTPNRLAIARAGLAVAPVALCGYRTIGESRANRYELSGNVHGKILAQTTPHLGATAIRRSACTKFNPAYAAGEDLDWWIRVTRHSSVHSSSEVGWLWRRHDGPRTGHGATQRLAGSHKLLSEHAEYFEEFPRASTFRWYRIGCLAAAIGDWESVDLAKRQLLRSRSQPDALVKWLRLHRRMHGAGIRRSTGRE